MRNPQICFLPGFSSGKSKCERRLELAQARSHTALVVHRRRKTRPDDEVRYFLAKPDQIRVHKTSPRWTNYEMLTKWPHDDGTPSKSSPEAESEATIRNSSLTSPLYEHLDPFLRLAGDLSLRDQNLLRYYLTVSPTTIYGMRPGALYCPVRDGTVHMIGGNITWLQYTPLSAETSAVGSIATKTSVTVLSRRSRIYCAMGQLIADPETCSGDQTISGLGFASLVENRMGNPASARKHATAVRNLVRVRQDTEPIPEEISLPTFYILVATGLGAQAFPDKAAFESTIDAFVTDMANMQRWALHSRNQSIIPSTFDKNAEYLSAWNHMFGPFSLLRNYVMPECNEKADREKRCHVALLWVINRILYGLQNDYGRTICFLDTLHRHVESATEPSPKGTYDSIRVAQAPRLKFTTMLAILRKVGAPFLHKDLDEADLRFRCSGNGESSERQWWEIFDVLQLLHLLSLKTRKSVLQQLSSWLIYSERPQSIGTKSENELIHLADEMRRTWIKRMLLETRLSTSGVVSYADTLSPNAEVIPCNQPSEIPPGHACDDAR